VNSALYKLKGITKYSNCLNRVINTVFYLSPSLTRILLNTEIISSFIKYLALYKRSRVSRIRGIEYLFLIVRVFSAR
jgi:hypothetical protein